ncbi:uncharacterized protein LY89DRAFT_653165 [Mollisia scopiformis]|uniref:Uncharacterized protein n=1 Tax=Mollisia scopiformis TaxID=149040 RepID=A0A194WXJ8_MOLSC|nr:uncharacterized protein LY89DRAFT_653165 [Mollisia scopiformis]KUJ12660.1 hypothetical protein LY89DRAFT_653165 [Mollisia scopiformis]
MADVRSMLKNERAARRIQHKHASYSTTGTLLCTVCHLQLKSESLWEGHLRSAGHIMRLQKLQEEPQATSQPPSKKRKASDDEDEGTLHKRSKPTNGIPEGFFDLGQGERSPVIPHGAEMQIPSRPATPSKPVELPIPPKSEPQIDEDEWAAFENEIATAEAQMQADNDAVISAPAVSAADLAKKSAEEEYATKKERQEAEVQGEKEDAARKMEDELEAMEGFEARVKRLREKREALRKKEVVNPTVVTAVPVEIPDEEDDDEDYEDEWDNFRMK